MKDVTKEFEIKLNQEFSKAYLKLSSEKLAYGGIEIPDEIIEKSINFGKKYEAESISDIKANYGKLTTYRSIPLSLLKWGVDFCIKFYKKYGELPDIKENDVYSLKRKKFPPRVGLNFCSLDSVKVRDVESVPKKNSFVNYKFGAIEFGIYDRFNENMPAVFIYKSTLSVSLKEDGRKKELENILSSNPLDTFDIVFIALDEKVRGKMLEIVSIQRAKLDNNEIPNAPEESDEIYDLESKLTKFPLLIGI